MRFLVLKEILDRPCLSTLELVHLDFDINKAVTPIITKILKAT